MKIETRLLGLLRLDDIYKSVFTSVMFWFTFNNFCHEAESLWRLAVSIRDGTWSATRHSRKTSNKSLEKFSKDLYGTPGGTYSARGFRPLIGKSNHCCQGCEPKCICKLDKTIKLNKNGTYHKYMTPKPVPNTNIEWFKNARITSALTNNIMNRTCYNTGLTLYAKKLTTKTTFLNFEKMCFIV